MSSKKMDLGLRPRTRASNKDKHPGLVDVDIDDDGAPAQKSVQATRTRRTATQMTEAREKEASEAQAARQEVTRKVNTVSDIEDKLRREDEAYRISANHPTEPEPGPVKHTTKPAVAAIESAVEVIAQSAPARVARKTSKDVEVPRAVTVEVTSGLGSTALSDAEDNTMDVDDDAEKEQDEEYQPSEGDNDVGESPETSAVEEAALESEVMVVEEEPEVPVKKTQGNKPKTPKISRSDVSAARITSTATGTPMPEARGKRKPSVSAVLEVPTPTKKGKPAAKSGLIANWNKPNSRHQKTSSTVTAAATVTQDEPSTTEDSMALFGGPAVDNDTNEAIERDTKIAHLKKSLADQKSLVTVSNRGLVHRVSKAQTKKDQRNGADHWSIKHLPEGADPTLFSDEVVPLARELAGTIAPWTALSPVQIQGIVDRVYGVNKFEVTLGDVWCGLIAYRLTDWRSSIGAAGLAGVEKLIKFNTATQDDMVVDANAEDADKPFLFRSPADVKEWVNDRLKEHPLKKGVTCAFHWREWTDVGDKHGIFESALILHAFAAHLTALVPIPAKYTRLDAKPIGALVLAIQAASTVQRALEFYSTGSRVLPQKALAAFSSQNWSDRTTRVAGKNVEELRATKHLPTIEAFKEKQWTAINTGADEYVERKKSVAPSLGGADAEATGMDEDDGRYYVLNSDA